MLFGAGTAVFGFGMMIWLDRGDRAFEQRTGEKAPRGWERELPWLGAWVGVLYLLLGAFEYATGRELPRDAMTIIMGIAIAGASFIYTRQHRRRPPDDPS
jgi:hypothetical protein